MWQLSLDSFYIDDLLRDDLLNSPLCGDLSSLADRSTDDLFDLYDSTIRLIIDALLPLRQHWTQ